MGSISAGTSSLFTPSERAFLAAVTRIVLANPFLPERFEAERAALGPLYREAGTVWHLGGELAAHRENLSRIRAQLGPLLDRTRDRLARDAAASPEERAAYETACFHFLYDRFEERLQTLIEAPVARVDFYDEFAREHGRLFRLPGSGPEVPAPAHLFAIFFQVRRTFHYLLTGLLGGSPAMARLRAAAWQSIFSPDLLVYQRSLFQHADEIPTLVTGPTGTGKDVVARAIAMSRYVPFDPGARRFTADHSAGYHPVSLSALSPALVESELFGHVRGAFTGAVADRAGRLSACKAGGTIFLDEIGELALDLQVKLLRLIQNRRYEPVGGIEPLPFVGKIITATHRDLRERIRAGAFREDLYFRICADQITTPSLRERLDEAPGELRSLLRAIVAKRTAENDVERTAARVGDWIGEKAPRDYAWPGNVRELEQCVAGVMWQGEFRFETGARATARASAAAPVEVEDVAQPFVEGTMTVDAMIDRYVTIVFAQTRSLAETARRLELDYRTVQGRIDHALLAQLTEGEVGEGEVDGLPLLPGGVLGRAGRGGRVGRGRGGRRSR